MKRITSIYVSYWIVSLMVNLPCIWINGTAGIENFEDFALCILALSSKVSTYCWYVAFFAFAVWTFPVIKVIMDNLKCNVHIKILLTILFFYGIRVILKILSHLGFTNFTITHFLSMYGATMPIWIMGYFVSCYDLFDDIAAKMERVNRGHKIEFIAVLFLSLLSIIRGYLICILGIKSNLEALWIILEIFCILILVHRICQVKNVDILLKWLGKQSLYIWLIHSVFMLDSIQKFTFILHIPIFVLIMVLSIAALISIPVGYIDRKLQRVLKIRNN